MTDNISRVLAFCALGLVASQAPAMQFLGQGGSGSPPPTTLTTDANLRPTINVRSKGVISVSLLSTAAFNAQDVKPDSIRFGPAGATIFGKAKLADLNGDGSVDLLLRFKTQDAGITCQTSQVTLSGTMLDGQPFTASDQIDTQGCR